MKTIIMAMLLTASTVWGAEPKTYQVTGPVLEVRDDMVVVQKGKEKWEIAKDKETSVKGELKPGSKVTIQYRMKAAKIEVKEEGKKK